MAETQSFYWPHKSQCDGHSPGGCLIKDRSIRSAYSICMPQGARPHAQDGHFGRFWPTGNQRVLGYAGRHCGSSTAPQLQFPQSLAPKQRSQRCRDGAELGRKQNNVGRLVNCEYGTAGIGKDKSTRRAAFRILSARSGSSYKHCHASLPVPGCLPHRTTASVCVETSRNGIQGASDSCSKPCAHTQRGIARDTCRSRPKPLSGVAMHSTLVVT